MAGAPPSQSWWPSGKNRRRAGHEGCALYSPAPPSRPPPLALLIGMSLGLSGATLQGFLRNPLADPAIVGVSPAASLGAVIALYTGMSLAFPLALPLMGIAGALICVLLLLALAGRGS